MKRIDTVIILVIAIIVGLCWLLVPAVIAHQPQQDGLLGLSPLSQPLVASQANRQTQSWQPPVRPQGETVNTSPNMPWPKTIMARLDGHPFRLEVAVTPEALERGLMGRRAIANTGGMLFVFEDSQYRHFWMKDTLVELDMVFVSVDNDNPKRGIVTQIIERAQPCLPTLGRPAECTVYSSSHPVAWVIELAGGRTRALGIQSGDTVNLNRR